MDHPGEARPLVRILKNNDDRAAREAKAPPTVAKLSAAGQAVEKTMKRLDPVFPELARRAGIPAGHDGYSASSRIQPKVTGGDVGTPTEGAAQARIEGRCDKDPQAVAIRELGRLRAAIVRAAGRVDDTGWTPILSSLGTRIVGYDPESGWQTEARPTGEVDQFLKALTGMGYMKPEGGLRPLVDAHQQAEDAARSVEIQLNRIESPKHGTGQKLAASRRRTRS